MAENLLNEITLKYEAIAIVANGPLKKDDGKTIDQHEFVVRINNFELGGEAGHKTDACFINRLSTLKDVPLKNSVYTKVPLILVNCLSNETELNICRETSFLELESIYCFDIDRGCVRKKVIGVSPEKHLLTGVVAAFEFLERACSVYLYGFDFFKSGPEYYFANDMAASQIYIKKHHQLSKEYSYLFNHPRVYNALFTFVG